MHKMDSSYEARIAEMHTDIRWIKQKMQDMCEEFRTANSTTQSKINKVSDRVDQLESWKDKVNGAIIGTYSILGLIWAKISKIL